MPHGGSDCATLLGCFADLCMFSPHAIYEAIAPVWRVYIVENSKRAAMAPRS